MKCLLTEVPKNNIKDFGNISGKFVLTICIVKKFTKVRSLSIVYRFVAHRKQDIENAKQFFLYVNNYKINSVELR